jgi:Ca2+-binding RTX toxin-like protein
MHKTMVALGALTLAGTPLLTAGPATGGSARCNGQPVTIDLNGGNMSPSQVGPLGRAMFDGTEGDDVILGTPAGEDIHGLGGDDVICGQGGSDLLTGDAGKDRLFGGGGSDELHQNGLEGGLLAGGVGPDQLIANGGNDTLRGGPDNDTLLGYRGNDALDGGSGITILAPAAEGPIPDSDDCNGGPGRDTEQNCETSSNFP